MINYEMISEDNFLKVKKQTKLFSAAFDFTI